MTETALPPPTVTSNTQAARLACETERARVLKLLALAPAGAVPDAIVEAIASGTPAAVIATNQRARAKAADSANTSGDRPNAGSGKWGSITSQFKTQRAAIGNGTDTEGSAA